jgi:exosortase E/protease (VPEID-CTERM system)
MSTTLVNTIRGPVRRTIARPPWFRLLALAALLTAEVAILSVRFDTGMLASSAGPAWLVGNAPQIVRLGIAALAAVIALGGRQAVGELRTSRADCQASGMRLGFLLTHLVLFVCFFWLTRQLLEHGGGYRMLFVAGWLAVSALTAGCWALALWPARVWLRLVVVTRNGLAAATAIALSAWMAGIFSERLWRPLAMATLSLIHVLLRCCYTDLIYRPSEQVIGTPAFEVRIAPECSGYEGMGLIAAFLIAYLWIDRRNLRFPQATVLVPLGLALAWLANSARLAALIIIGSSWSKDIASGGFHSQAGWLAFNAIALGLVAGASHLKFFAGDASIRHQAGTNAAAAYLAPFLAVVAAGMLTRAFSDSEALHPLRIVPAIALVWWFRGSYARAAWSWSLRPVVLGAAVFALWWWLVPAGGGVGPAAELASWPPVWRALWWCCRGVEYVVVAPVVEELAFRGYLSRWLIEADFEAVPLGKSTAWSLIVSSVAFGALHGHLWPAGFLAGVVYALALKGRGRLGDAIVAHTTTNALLACCALITGNWSFWS